MLTALRYRDFRLLWSGMLVSNVGIWMQMFGQGWLVVQLAVQDGSPQLAPLYLGFVGLARAVPGLLFGLVAGAVADRLDRRQILFTTQSTACLVVLVLAVLTASGGITILGVVLLAAAATAVQIFDLPTRQSMLPRLVPPRQLASAIGLSSAAHNLPQMVAPALGGLLIIPIGIAGLFFINAAGYFAVLTALFFMRPVPALPSRRQSSVLGSVRDGLRYIARDPVVRWVLLLLGNSAFFVWPYMFLLPAVTRNVLHAGATELSWLMAATGLGALTGSLVIANLSGVRRLGRVYLGFICAAGVSVMAFALQTTLVPALVAAFCIGLTCMVTGGLSNTILQTSTPDHLRGRVMSLHTMVFMGLVPLGQLLLGAVGSVVGVDVALVIGGAIAAAAGALALIRLEPIRDLQPASRPHPTP